MPQMVHACADTDDPDLALARVLHLVTAVVRRSAYLVLLLENPPALRELALLCGASPWIAEQMAQHPALLDEFLDRTSLYSAPCKAELQSQLQQQVARLKPDDLEAQMNALRYFKAAQVLRVAASELGERLPVMKVSDNLTWIARFSTQLKMLCVKPVLILLSFSYHLHSQPTLLWKLLPLASK